MRKHPIPKRPLQSCSARAPTPSWVAQFARDSANSWTPDVLFTSLLRAGPPSSRETAPIPRHLTHHLRHFCEAGPPSSPETMNSWTADPLFTSLLRAGSPSSRETAPILKHLTYYACQILHFPLVKTPLYETKVATWDHKQAPAPGPCRASF